MYGDVPAALISSAITMSIITVRLRSVIIAPTVIPILTSRIGSVTDRTGGGNNVTGKSLAIHQSNRLVSAKYD